MADTLSRATLASCSTHKSFIPPVSPTARLRSPCGSVDDAENCAAPLVRVSSLGERPRVRARSKVRSEGLQGAQMTVSQYWVTEWLDDHEITNEWELEHVINTPQGMKSISEAIAKGVSTWIRPRSTAMEPRSS